MEKSNQQFKNKIKFKMISQSARFRLDFDKLQRLKEHHEAIFLKEVPVGTYDIQLLWKIYFPLKFLNDRNNMFFY